ncbi:potassium-transporting ATPase subunit KdpC [Geomonas sp. Red32]|uniref:potassium-transporting ATPase subunit KdpC n=1 Tax=Geomonas sp. Red32 TaxID=2912856 RepID=UPI00202CA9CF|nr:potassium-transporting ATPase subunit KdpC [Geomonas sp. Red32]MCM0081325.1 potassium-transporting ATPase subunit KdpC [Geomonas sp. Red32]
MKEIRPAIMLFILFTVICGGVYPALVTGIATVLFPAKAQGSFITGDRGGTLGSRLIGQPFSEAKYFWPRPSATSDFPYNALGSGGSNLSPTNPDYLKTVADRVKALRESGVTGVIPADLVEASASGLDPDISPAAASVQIKRIARVRGMSEGVLRDMVATHTRPPKFGFVGEPRVHVLELNLALDGVKVNP